MRITAIRDDNIVLVDGVARTVVWSAVLPEGWRAIQWNNSIGEIEFSQPPGNFPLADDALPKLVKQLWEVGTGPRLDVAQPSSDTLAIARAALIDSLIVEAAKDDAAPQIFKDAAVEIENAAAGAGVVRG